MNDFIKSDLQNIWHPFTQQWNKQPNILINQAKGVWLYTADGRKILDAVSSWWVNLFGHANPQIAQAISEQAKQLEHVIFAGFTHPPAIELSEKLLSILPDNQSKIFFSDNGSTAVEVALKMAFQYWYNKDKKRHKVVAIEGAYHGDTFGAMAVAERNAFNKPFHPFLFDVEFIEFPNGKNDEKVIEQFRKIVENGQISTFIFEPLLQGTAGMRTYSEKTLSKLIKIAQAQEVICIADEVLTGFGRTAKIFASEYLSEKPDIFCLSKGITGGFMPLGVTSCTEKIHNAFVSEDKMKTFFHGHSYTANPLACAAANTSIKLLLSDVMRKNIHRIEEKHRQFIVKNNLQNISNHIGTVLSITIQNDENTSYFNNIRDYLYNYFLDCNILMRPLGNIIYIIPPYIITDDELNYIYTCILKLLNSKS